MRNNKTLGTILLSVGIGVLVFTAAAFLLARYDASQHIGIIGGADAPTAVYLMQSGAFTPYLLGGAAGLALVIAGIVLRVRKGK